MAVTSLLHSAFISCALIGEFITIQVHKAIEMVEGAQEIFALVLSTNHPRNEAALRNLAHIRGKCSQLEMRYHIPKPKMKLAAVGVSAVSGRCGC